MNPKIRKRLKMSCSTIFELSLEEEIGELVKDSKGQQKSLKNIFKRLLGEIHKMKKDINFYQNNCQRHKQIIENLKSENRRLQGELYDFEVPDIDCRPRNPSPVYDSE